MADLKEAYRRLDPALPLDGDLLERYYVGRPGDPVGKLAQLLEVSESTQHVLLVGQRGVGKTTELYRLSKTLGSHTLVLIHNLDFESISNAAIGISGLTRHLANHAISCGRIRAFDSVSEVDIHRARQQADAVALLTSAINRLREAGIKPILLIDGLEKKRREQLDEVAHFVTELVRLECSMVVVVPLALVLLPNYSNEVAEWDRIVSLPAISLRDRNDRPNEAGRELLNSVFDRRCDGPVLAEDAKEVIVGLSAGIHRALLTLAQDACLNAMTKGMTLVDRDCAEEAADERRLEMSGFLTPSFLRMLASVRDTKLVNNFPSAIPLLERNSIVSYQNSTAWYEVNPLVSPALDAFIGTSFKS